MTETRLTPRGHGVVALAAGLVAAGAVAGPQFRGGELASWGFGLVVFLLLYRAFFAARAAAAAGARLERRLLDRPGDGRVFRVELRVCTPRATGVDLVVEDEAPEGLERLTPPRGAVPAPPGGCAGLVYRLRGRPGRHRWGAVRLAARDWLGLLEAHLGSVEPAGVREAAVPPRAAGGVARSVGRLVEAVAAASGLRGAGTVWLELREYMPDDDSRLIDWKSSARTGRLLVKVFERETRGRVLVVADLACGSWGVPGHTVAEAAARVALGAAAWAARRGEEAALAVLAPGGGFLASGWLRGVAAARRFASLLAGAEYPAEGVASPPGCGCPRVDAEGLAAALGYRRPAALVIVSGLGGGCRRRAEELEELGRRLRAARVAGVAAVPRPPRGLEEVYAVRAAAVAAAAPRWLLVWDDALPLGAR